MKETSKNLLITKSQRSVYWVDSYANGLSFGQTKVDSNKDVRDLFPLELGERAEVANLRSRYPLNKKNPLHELELNLMRLSRQGELSSALICLGVMSDPFLPFEGKFHASQKFLQLFTKYKPGLLMVQTRSPLIVLAVPVLQKLGKYVSVTIAIETHDQKMADRYAPELPAIEDRIRAANSLRRLGIEVNIQVSPLLPYGDWRKDAPGFADFLAVHSDYVHVMPLSGRASAGSKTCAVAEAARKLAFDRKFHWLRSDAANPLLTELEKIAPQKLVMPQRETLREKQLDIFAA